MMTADDIRDARAVAEDQIRFVLDSLQNKTGLCAVAISIDTVEATRIEDRYPRLIIGNIQIKLESL